tara:strand:+ start:8558 stop:9532 length:975 start_codon:yes stop_codon:yes gene_type:complete
MKNVKVILISVVLCAAVFANSRIAALGGDAGFWPGDKANIAIFPATINDHDFVELDGIGSDNDGTTADAGVDATILWGDATTWGFNFDGDDAATWMNIMWGNGDVGLSVQYMADKGNTETDGFAIGYGQNFEWGELGCGFTSVDDATSYWANWRDDMDVWVFDSAKASLMSTDDGSDNTSMSLGFDMFTHLDAGGADVLFGLGVDYHTESDGTNDATSMTLPTATLAVEAGLTDWATLRAWATHTYDFSCTNDAAGSDPCADDTNGPSDDNNTSYGFGLGFNWGQATLDMQVGEGLFLDPVTTMSGWEDADLASEASVTLSYSF